MSQKKKPVATQGAERPWWAPAAIVMLVILANGVSLGGEFVHDDVALILRNPHIADWSHVPTLFTDAWRPLKRVSLMVDHALWGTHPAGYHATNVLLQALASLAMWWFVLSLGASRRLALFAGLLFAAHPIHTEAIAVITNRKEMMGTAFVLLAFVAWTRLPRGWKALLGTYLCFAGALLSKEIIGAAFPLLLLAHAVTRQIDERRAAILRAFKALAPLALGVLGLFLTRLEYLGDNFAPLFSEAQVMRMSRGAMPDYGSFLGTALSCIPDYWRLLFLPVGLCAEPPIVASTGLLSAGPLLGAAVFLGTFLLAAWALRRGHGLVAFGLVFIPLGLLPAANFVPLTHVFLAERFAYLSSVGACLLLAVLADWLSRRASPSVPWRNPGLLAFASVLIIWTGLSLVRNREWKDDLTISAVTLRQNPNSQMARFILARHAIFSGDALGTIEHVGKLLERRPDEWMMTINLAEALTDLGRLDEAEARLRRVHDLAGGVPLYHAALGNLFVAQGRRDQALAAFSRAGALDPQLAAPHANAASLLLKEGSLDAAAAACGRGIRANPMHPDPHYLLGLTRQKQGRVSAAREHLGRALSLGLSPGRERVARRALTEMEQGDSP